MWAVHPSSSLVRLSTGILTTGIFVCTPVAQRELQKPTQGENLRLFSAQTGISSILKALCFAFCYCCCMVTAKSSAFFRIFDQLRDLL